MLLQNEHQRKIFFARPPTNLFSPTGGKGMRLFFQPQYHVYGIFLRLRVAILG
jgi:hypothetical protein